MTLEEWRKAFEEAIKTLKELLSEDSGIDKNTLKQQKEFFEEKLKEVNDAIDKINQ